MIYRSAMDNPAMTKTKTKSPLHLAIEAEKLKTNDPSKAGSASDKMGQIIRSEWDDYEKRFQPYDQQLIDIATNKQTNLSPIIKTGPWGTKTVIGHHKGPSVNDQAIQRAQGTVADSFDVAQGTLQRNNSRLGLSMAGDELMANNRNTKNNQTISELSAINGTRMHTQDRNMKIMSGDASVGLRDGRLTGGK